MADLIKALRPIFEEHGFEIVGRGSTRRGNETEFHIFYMKKPEETDNPPDLNIHTRDNIAIAAIHNPGEKK